MQLSINWLKRHLDFKYDDLESFIKILEEKLPIIGIEIDDFSYINPLLRVKILSCEKFGKLSLCKTFVSDYWQKKLGYSDELTVLCGAENVKKDMWTVLAPLGTKVGKEKILISRRKINGIESCGMFTSFEEIDKEKLYDGIIEEKEGPELFHFHDCILNLSVPTNRWDLLNVRGIARELSINGFGQLKELLATNGEKDFPIKVENSTDVMMSFATIKNIEVKKEVLDLMENLGNKSSSPLQTLNDFSILDIGHPIHIYDLDKVSSLKIRQSINETFETFKGKFITKDKDIIIEDNRPLCVGGIIGIEGYSLDTKNVILEAGYFRNENISEIISDSAKQFYLGIDYNQMTLYYLLTLLNGEKSKVIFAGEKKNEDREIILTYDDFVKISGKSMSLENMKKSLEICGCSSEILEIKRDDSINNLFALKCFIPSWRKDLQIKTDLIQEIIRFNPIEMENTEIKNKNFKIKNEDDFLRDFLVSEGFIETYSMPFAGAGDIKIKNAMNKEKSFLRRDLVTSIFEQCESFLSTNDFWGVKIFEIGKIYPSEDVVCAIGISGKPERSWISKEKYDFFYLKKIWQKLSNLYDIEFTEELNNKDFFYGLKGKNVLLGQYKNMLDSYYLQFKLKKKLAKEKVLKGSFYDLCFSFDSEISWHEIEKNLNIKAVLFDVFTKDNIKNFAFTVRTENESFIDEIIKSMEKIGGRIKK